MGKKQRGLVEETSWAKIGDQELSSGSVGSNTCGSPEAIAMMQVRDEGHQELTVRVGRILELF